MNLDTQTLVNIVLSGALSVMGWFAREMWDAVKELKAELSHLREEIPTKYISRNDYKSDLKEVKEMLYKIFDKLENKVDK